MTRLQRIVLGLFIMGAAIYALAALQRGVALRPGTGQGYDLTRQSNDHNGEPDKGNPRATAQTPFPQPADIATLLGEDARDSSHPVERAVANGTVLDWRIEKTPMANEWSRVRLVKTNVQPRLVRVVERWRIDPRTGQASAVNREMFLADQLILKAARGINETRLRQQLEAAGMTIDSLITDGLFTVRLSQATLDAVPQAMKLLTTRPDLAESVEPDGVGFGGGTPNDAYFSEQWGLHNTGQSGGVADADVDAPEFWDIVEGAPGIVVAVLDSGLNYTHPDLQNIAWTNPGEINGDGIDNDANGKVDDIRGWDFVNNDNNPTDDHGHGSNVTGIIAANRNNGQGVAGMLGGVRILACKILNASNSGLTSNLIAATTYARQQRVPVMNLSLQNYPYSSTLDAEFSACASTGIVLCICAGNQGVDNDTTPNYPSSYPHANIIAIGNHDRTDVRWSGSSGPSNYGAQSVDLFAPGRDILSPVLGTGYAYYTGTSQATPFVTAVCAAIKYANPTWSALEIKNSILSSVVKKVSYDGICTTGGRLNAVDAVANAFRQLPTQDSDSDGISNLFEYLAGTRIDLQSSRPAVFTDTNGGFLRIGIPRVLRPDAHFEIETSGDLLTWTSAGVTDFSTAGTLLGGIPRSGAPRGFLRIRALPTP